jgi:hypothetical protein
MGFKVCIIVSESHQDAMAIFRSLLPSTPYLKLGLVLYDIAVLLVKADDVRAPGSLVDVFEEGDDGRIFSLGFTFDLATHRARWRQSDTRGESGGR